ncbi:MAG: hypothetical protein ACOYLO_17480 [Ferruginibacter sp.]
MINNFSIEIPNEKAATYKVVTFIIAVINLIAFAYFLFYSSQSHLKNLIIIGFVISVLGLLLFIVKQYSSHISSFRVEIAFIICATVWLFSGAFLLGFLLLVFAVFGLITNKKTIIHFTQEGIRYPSFPEKYFKWEVVDFVILKDDILSIELKDNRLFQFSLDKNIAAAIDSAVFNNFCKTMAEVKQG